MLENTESRNLRMFIDYNSGRTLSAISEIYGMSRQRAHQIIQAVSKKTGAPLRGKSDHIRESIISQSMLDEILTHKVDYKEVAKYLQVSTSVLARELKRLGYSVVEITREARLSRVKHINDEHIAGNTLVQLAEKYGLQKNSMATKLARFRKETGELGPRKAHLREKVAV